MHWMPPIRVAAAALPLALYLLWLGWRNIGPRPRVGSGTLDLAALVLGLVGIIAVGPARLLVAAYAAGLELSQLVVLMVLVAAWVGLAAGRELDSFVVYNCTADRFWPALTGTLDELALPYRCHGNHVELGQGPCRLSVEFFEPLRNVTVYVTPTAAGSTMRQIVQRLRLRLSRGPRTGQAIGWAFLLAGCVVLGMAGCLILIDLRVI